MVAASLVTMDALAFTRQRKVWDSRALERIVPEISSYAGGARPAPR